MTPHTSLGSTNLQRRSVVSKSNSQSLAPMTHTCLGLSWLILVWGCLGCVMERLLLCYCQTWVISDWGMLFATEHWEFNQKDTNRQRWKASKHQKKLLIKVSRCCFLANKHGQKKQTRRVHLSCVTWGSILKRTGTPQRGRRKGSPNWVSSTRLLTTTTTTTAPPPPPTTTTTS